MWNLNVSGGLNTGSLENYSESRFMINTSFSPYFLEINDNLCHIPYYRYILLVAIKRIKTTFAETESIKNKSYKPFSWRTMYKLTYTKKCTNWWRKNTLWETLFLNPRPVNPIYNKSDTYVQENKTYQEEFIKTW